MISADKLRRLPIATRMLASALVLTVLILPAAGALLSWNFREAVNTAFNERLESLLNVVIAGVSYDVRQDTLVTNRQLGDSRFDRVFSGWYWQVRDEGERVLTSRSLWDQRLAISHEPGMAFRTIIGPRDKQLRLLERDIRLPNLDEVLHVQVAASLDEVEAQVARFQTLLWLSLATLGGLLIVLTGLQIRWGLAPLRRIEQSLKAVEQGRQPAIETNLPRELARLADAINTVLDRDQRLMERGRTAAGNLAHALKTPVAVLGTLAERLPQEQQQAMAAELKRLDEAVRHHLARASAAGPVALGAEQELIVVLKPVVEGVRRLAGRRGLEFHSELNSGLRVRIDAQDLQEIVGNLLENAINWAKSFINLTGTVEGGWLVLSVSDDGPGMSPETRQQALSRGGKLDEAKSGSGLGLSIVTELVELHGGELRLDDSPEGGLRAEVILPLAQLRSGG
ncbi:MULTISPECIES: sensor histidine kinase [Marinobacter]|uniref:histidine kinase n=2 Tax=Gammaproteobacteria TaxID=1236 RepID=A0ABU2HLH2_9GAMM|nr:MULTISPECIES: HAMP domain-containing sensor histidine kinase [unclassified Marinobacter]MBK1885037.1 HAMP domain-containing histidine kinase [Marinobacter sp. DY40_1A1]MDS1311416.1 HAMP domain-containing sensor histidine kinase [Marinobacter sp. F60267]